MNKYTNLDDHVLLTLALDGDNKALGQLIKNNKNIIRDNIFGYVENIQDQEDLFQEIIFGAIKSIRGNCPPRKDVKFSTWLYSIAQNKRRDYYRQKSRKNKIFSSNVATYESKEINPSVEYSYIHHEEISIKDKWVSDQIQKILTPLESNIISSELEAEEKAQCIQRLGITDVNFRVTRHRAISKLNKEYKKQFVA